MKSTAIFPFFLLMVWGVSSLFAQQVYKLSLANTAQQVFSEGFYLESVQDARKDTFLIGLVCDKAGIIKVPAVFDRPLAYECLSALRTLTISIPEKQPVRMRIHQLFIDEHIQVVDDYGLMIDGLETVDLDVSFDMQREGAWTEVFRTNCFWSIKNQNVELKYSHNISKALAICWAKFNRHALSGKIALQAGRARDTSLLRPRGIFPSYRDFLYQTPDSLDLSRVSYVRDSADTVISAALSGDNERNPFAAWGFSDGRRLYVLWQNRYVPVIRTSKGLTIKGDRMADISKALVGVSEFAWTGQFDQRALSQIGPLLTQKEGYDSTPFYLIDLKTGIPVCSPGSRMEFSTVHLLASELLLESARIYIRIDGEEVCTLAPGQLYSLKIQSDHVHPLLEIQCGSNVYRTYLYPALGSDRVYLVRQKGKHALTADIQPIARHQVVPEPAQMPDIRQGKYHAPCAPKSVDGNP